MIELLEHNKETYKRLCDVLEDNNKCALVQATGTGKSYIAGKYIEEHASAALILVPTNAIADAWSDLLSGTEKEVDIITYQAFAKEPQNYLDYDLVIADEMHHLGSDVWGKKFVETYLQSENHKIIGLTATEIRYLDNSRDMAEEIFENIRVDGCDLPKAINTGVLPTFKYVSALYCDESDFDEWKEKAGKIKDIKTQTELKGRLDVCIKNMVSVKQAVNENLTDDYKKIIVFLNNVESKETALEMFRDVFPTENFYDVDYSKQRTANNEQINSFKSDSNRAVLFAVDMLNEGIHIKGTDCVIMFRKTVSPQVYLQQLGRGLASGTDKTPVIFDFVCNTKNIKAVFKDSEICGFVEKANRSIKDSEKKIVIKSYEEDIESVINSINSLFSTKMTQEVKDYIINNQDKTSVEIASIFGIDRKDVTSWCYKNGIKLPPVNEVITKEIEDFIKNNTEKTITELSEILGIKNVTIRAYCRKNGIKVHKNIREITDEEIQYMMKNSEKTAQEIGKEINRSPAVVWEYCRRNGIKISEGHKKPRSFSDEEIEFIKNNPDMKILEISKKLGRSYESVKYQVRKKELKVKENRRTTIDMTEEVKDFINRNTDLTAAEISKRLGIEVDKIYRYLYRNNIQLKNGRSKPIVQIDTNTGVMINKFSSTNEAAISLGNKNYVGGIRLAAKGEYKESHGYKWMYEEDYKKMIAEQKVGEA